MEQLCISRIRAGEHDEMISILIRNGISDRAILHEMMRHTKGHESPAAVLERIEYLREQGLKDNG